MKNLILHFLILMPVLVTAQDILYKTDNTKQEVVIKEIHAGVLKYKPYNHLNGPLYTISKSEVALVIYENGRHESFTSASNDSDPALAKKEKRFLKVTENKNAIFLNTIEFLNSGVGISYLREFGDGKFDLHIPFATSFSTPGMDNALTTFGGLSGCKLTKTHYDIGLGVYFNTSGKRSVTHFIGPLVRNAQYTGKYYSYSSENFYATEHTTTMNETSLMINNGFLYRITPNFNMMINIAVGTFVGRAFSSDPNKYNSYSQRTHRSVALHAGFHFGYRF